MRPRFASLEAMRNLTFPARSLIFLLALSLAGCGHSRASRSVESPLGQQRAARTFAIRYVVKLTPTAGEIFAKGDFRRTLQTAELPAEPLKEASRQRRISRWEPVYPGTLKNDPVGLNRMYLLIADEETSSDETRRTFEALTDWVEYIEPGRRL